MSNKDQILVSGFLTRRDYLKVARSSPENVELRIRSKSGDYMNVALTFEEARTLAGILLDVCGR